MKPAMVWSLSLGEALPAVVLEEARQDGLEGQAVEGIVPVTVVHPPYLPRLRFTSLTTKRWPEVAASSR